MTTLDLDLIQSLADAVSAARQVLFFVGGVVLLWRLREENRR